MSETYEKARAIAEAAANGWDKLSDTRGIARLADMILEFGAAPSDDGRCMCVACQDARHRQEETLAEEYSDLTDEQRALILKMRDFVLPIMGRANYADALQAGIADIIAICDQDARDQAHNATQASFGRHAKAYAEGRGTACKGIATRLRALLPQAP